MADTWTLTFAANGIELPAPARYEAWELKAQAVDRTAAGQVRAYDKTLSQYRARVVWQDLDATQKANLAAFFHNEPADSPAGVHGVMNAFTLTDHDAGAYAARFATPDLTFETNRAANRWNVTLELITDALIAT